MITQDQLDRLSYVQQPLQPAYGALNELIAFVSDSAVSARLMFNNGADVNGEDMEQKFVEVYAAKLANLDTALAVLWRPQP